MQEIKSKCKKIGGVIYLMKINKKNLKKISLIIIFLLILVSIYSFTIGTPKAYAANILADIGDKMLNRIGQCYNFSY